MWRYLLYATAIVMGIVLLFIALPLRMPLPRPPRSAPPPEPRETLPVFPHSSGGRIVGEAPFAFDALPECFTPRWEWQPGGDRIRERVTARAVEALATGRVHGRIALDAATGTPLEPRAAAAALRAPSLPPLPVGSVLRSGNCVVGVERGRIRIRRGDDDLTIAGARLYRLRTPAGPVLIAVHDGPALAEVGAYLPAPEESAAPGD